MMATNDASGCRVPIAVLGIPFDPVTTREAIARIEGMIVAQTPHYLVTANVDFLVQARTDIELRRILLDADLVLCDGTPVVWASALFGNRLPERVAGSDLVPELIRVSAQKGYRLFFLGASEAAATKAVERLLAQYPGLRIVGHYSPPYHPLLEMDHAQIRQRILQAQPDILLVCFGCPKQEKWIAMHYRQLGVPVAAGVGGTIDFLAGERRRAPRWMRRTGTEWVYRLLQEPRRLFRRYAQDLAAFSLGLAAQSTTLGGFPARRRVAPALPQPIHHDQALEIRLPHRLDLAAARVWARGLTDRADRIWLLEASDVEQVDSSGLAWLTTLRKRLGRDRVILVAPSRRLLRVLERMRLACFFPCAPDISTALALAGSRENCPPLAVTRPGADGVVELRFHGEITASNARTIWAQAKGEFSRITPGQEWRLDLREVPFIDTSGLSLLLRTAAVVRQSQAQARFSGVGPEVLNVIRHSRLEEELLREKPRGVAGPPSTMRA